jgi:DNA-binding MurR/RpiR family transcriptional regulator
MFTCLGVLRLGSATRPGVLTGFLTTLTARFVKELAFDGFVDFKEFLRAAQVWAATAGNPAFIVLLLKEAMAIALQGDRKSVVVGDLAEAYDKGITGAVSTVSRNPFEMSLQALAADVSAIKLC